MSKINILCIYSDLSGVGYYRTIWPSKNLEKLYPGEFKVEIQGSNSVDWNNDSYLKQFSIIHYHRTMCNYEQMELLMKKLRGFGIKLIMDLDDYWSVSPQHPSYHMVKRDKLNEKILGNVKTADWMTVTTPIFADEIKKFNKNVFVLPNTIDPTIEQFIPQKIEREKVAVGWLGGCYDGKTEILTENGWKLFEYLKEGKEKVATLNSKNGKLEYQLPIKYFKYLYNGKLNYCENKNICYAVTPNHNMYISIANPGANDNLGHKKLNFELNMSENIFGKYFHCKKDAIWEGKEEEFFILPQIEYKMANANSNRNIICEPISFKMDNWLKFFGFWLAEGWTSKTKNCNQVGIAQKKDNNYLSEMENILKEFGFNPKFTKDKYQLRVINKQLWTYLLQFGGAKEKHIPKFLLDLSARQLNIMLEWYLKGDGHIEKDQFLNGFRRKRAWTVSKELANNLMEIALKTGIAASIKNRGKRNSKMLDGRNISGTTDCYQVGFYSSLLDSKHNQLTPPVSPEHQKEIDYNGYVYCVEVPNHLLYVRRKDSTNVEKGFWCGNSSHNSDLEILKGMFQRLRVDPVIDKTQIVLCGYDLRGSHTDINQQTGEQRVRDIQPKETSWYQFERIFTDDYKIIKDKKYFDFLMKFKREDYPDEEKQVYRRVWTKLLSKYATNYNLFDIALAPLSPNIFNYVKSQLKIIESGFHKKMLIAQDYGPYTIDGVHGKNCLLVQERKNHKDWFKFVKQGVESKAMREDLGEALYETVKVKYHIDNDSKLRREFYLSLLK